MGGTVPLGYDCVDRRLVVNEAEAETVREIFWRYLRLGSVRSLKASLDKDQIRSKVRPGAGAERPGGASFSRGALYRLLKNRTYIGEVHHRSHNYPGQHQAIVPQSLWGGVARRLAANNQAHRMKAAMPVSGLLTGKILMAMECVSRLHTRRSNRSGTAITRPGRRSKIQPRHGLSPGFPHRKSRTS